MSLYNQIEKCSQEGACFPRMFKVNLLNGLPNEKIEKNRKPMYRPLRFDGSARNKVKMHKTRFENNF